MESTPNSGRTATVAAGTEEHVQDENERGVYAISVMLSIGLLWAVAMCALHLPMLWPPATVEVTGTLQPAPATQSTEAAAPLVKLDGDPRQFVIPRRGEPSWNAVAAVMAESDRVVLTVDAASVETNAGTGATRVYEISRGGEVVWSRLRLMPGHARALSFWGSMLGAILLAMAAVKGFDRGRFNADTAIS